MQPALSVEGDGEVVRILQDAEVRKRLNAVGTEASPVSRDAFVERIRTDAARYSRVIAETGVRIER